MTTDAESADPRFEPPQLRNALRQTASALKAADIPFALAGGYALWVHGAPEPEHDVDLAVPEVETEAAAGCLAQAGLEVVRPPEDWLFKVYVDDALVDVLHRLQDVPVTRELIERSDEHEILGIRIPVLPATDIMITKLQALSEHYCNFEALLAVVRAIREKLDWERIRCETEGYAFAEAFLFLLERLEITPSAV
jgi:predicted nucleotidyltransferase